MILPKIGPPHEALMRLLERHAHQTPVSYEGQIVLDQQIYSLLYVLAHSIVPPDALPTIIADLPTLMSARLAKESRDSPVDSRMKKTYEITMASLTDQLKKAETQETVRCNVCGFHSPIILGSKKTFHGEAAHCSNCGNVIKAEDIRKYRQHREAIEQAELQTMREGPDCPSCGFTMSKNECVNVDCTL